MLTALDEALVQTRPAVALVGDDIIHTGLARSLIYRWFTDPQARRIYPQADHPQHSRALTSDLRAAYTRPGPGSRAGEITDALLAVSEEFTTLWNKHEIGVRRPDSKRFVHPDLGILGLQCQSLLDPGQDQILLVYTATPGTDSYDKLQLLSVLGDRQTVGGAVTGSSCWVRRPRPAAGLSCGAASPISTSGAPSRRDSATRCPNFRPQRIPTVGTDPCSRGAERGGALRSGDRRRLARGERYLHRPGIDRAQEHTRGIS